MGGWEGVDCGNVEHSGHCISIDYVMEMVIGRICWLRVNIVDIRQTKGGPGMGCVVGVDMGSVG